MVAYKAVETVLLTQNSIRKNQHVFILADKGNKKGNKNLVKCICWYDIDDCKVNTFLLDVNYTDEDIEEITGALEQSLRRLFPTNIPDVFMGNVQIVVVMAH